MIIVHQNQAAARRDVYNHPSSSRTLPRLSDATPQQENGLQWGPGGGERGVSLRSVGEWTAGERATHALADPSCKDLLMSMTLPTVPAAQMRAPARMTQTLKTAPKTSAPECSTRSRSWCSYSHLRRANRRRGQADALEGLGDGRRVGDGRT